MVRLVVCGATVCISVILNSHRCPCVCAFLSALYEKADIKAPEEKTGKHLIIGVSSDRGLCGAIHSNVGKAIKSEIASLTSTGKDVMVVNVGDKLRALLQR